MANAQRQRPSLLVPTRSGLLLTSTIDGENAQADHGRMRDTLSASRRRRTRRYLVEFSLTVPEAQLRTAQSQYANDMGRVLADHDGRIDPKAPPVERERTR